MTIDGSVLIADEGKVFKRKNTDEGMDIFGDKIYLGYSYYINGKKLEQPHQDVPDDFLEIDRPTYFKEFDKMEE